MSEISNFWLVTAATKDSELVDILYKTNIRGMGYQFYGGLKPDEIIGIYTTYKEAKKMADKQLLRFKP